MREDNFFTYKITLQIRHHNWNWIQILCNVIWSLWYSIRVHEYLSYSLFVFVLFHFSFYFIRFLYLHTFLYDYFVVALSVLFWRGNILYLVSCTEWFCMLLYFFCIIRDMNDKCLQQWLVNFKFVKKEE